MSQLFEAGTSPGKLNPPQAAETQAAILNALPAHIALFDPDGVILVVNESWRHFATANVLRIPDFGLGAILSRSVDGPPASVPKGRARPAADYSGCYAARRRSFAWSIPADGAKAVAFYAMQRAEIAVVITDMMMPVMDGPVLIAALRRITPEVQIIASSGLNAGANIAPATSAGVKHFLAKSFAADMLLGLLKTLLSESSGRADSRSPL